jgi:hypothetical protein
MDDKRGAIRVAGVERWSAEVEARRSGLRIRSSSAGPDRSGRMLECFEHRQVLRLTKPRSGMQRASVRHLEMFYPLDKVTDTVFDKGKDSRSAGDSEHWTARHITCGLRRGAAQIYGYKSRSLRIAGGFCHGAARR